MRTVLLVILGIIGGFAALIALLFIILTIFTTVKQVSVGQVGVVTRFGRVVSEEQSGLHFILPWPIESIRGMTVQTQKEQENAEAATNDLQDVTTAVALNYRLNPEHVRDVYQNVGVNYVHVQIEPQLLQVAKSIISQYNAADLVQKRPQVVDQLDKELSAKLEPEGYIVQSVSIVNFSFSPQYSQAIEQKQVAQQNVETQRYNLNASQLQAQAQEKQKTSLSPQYLELQAIQKWNGKMPQAVSGGGNIFGINLQQ